MMTGAILALNSGSSSLKYAVFDGEHALRRDTIEGVRDPAAAIDRLLGDLAAPPVAVGHRLVHGGPDLAAPVRIDAKVRRALDAVVPLSPLHLPAELAVIDAVTHRLADEPPNACVDTAFHRDLPAAARRLALPDEIDALGVRRYGFHGLSYASITRALPPALRRRAVIAHLGSGASLAAIRDGRSIDTTMSFSPTGGIVMATRPGDLDPGLLVFLLDRGYDARKLEDMLNHRAGLTALSGTTGDMRRLLDARTNDPRAALAVDVFCYHVRKAIGAFAAALGGLDALVFTGGVGEHAAPVRAEICAPLGFLGIALDPARNTAGAPRISTARCEVLVMRTDEEREIARATREVMSAERSP